MDINSYYLYNLKTGETIGIKKGENNPEVQTTGETVEVNGQTYNIIAGQSVSNTVLEYGTAEDLSFDQLVTLFLQGDLTVEELEKGLKAKRTERYESVKNFHVENDGNTVKVTFSFNYKNYNLVCNTQSASSQFDDEGHIVSGAQVMKLAGGFCLTPEEFNKYFTEISEKSIEYNSNWTNDTNAKIYRTKNGMTIAQIEAKLRAQDYKPASDSTFTRELLYDAGFTSDYYINKYFDEVSENNYVMKSDLIVNEKKVSNVRNLRNALGLYSEVPWRESDFNTYVNSMGSLSAKLTSQYISQEDLNKLNKDVEEFRAFMSEYFSVEGHTNRRSKAESITYEEWEAELKKRGYYDLYKQIVPSGMSPEELFNRRGRDGNGVSGRFVYNISADLNKKFYAQNVDPITSNALSKYKENLSKEIGKPVNQIRDVDILRDLNVSETKIFEALNIKRMAEDTGYAFGSVIRLNGREVDGFFGSLMSYYSNGLAYSMSHDCQSDLLKYINKGEPEMDNMAVIQAIYKAAGITDADSISDKYKKMKNFTTNMSWAQLFEHLYMNGFIPANAADMPEPELVNQDFKDVQDEIILENFLGRDVDNTERMENLDETEDGPMTESLYNDKKDEITVPTTEEKEKLVEEVLEKLIEEGPSMYLYGMHEGTVCASDIDVDWVQVLISAMGGKNYKNHTLSHFLDRGKGYGAILPYGLRVRISFELNGHKYSLSIAPGWGTLPENSSLHDWTEYKELEELGADKELLNKFLEPTASKDGVVLKYMFAPHDGINTFDELKDFVKKQSKESEE